MTLGAAADILREISETKAAHICDTLTHAKQCFEGMEDRWTVDMGAGTLQGMI